MRTHPMNPSRAACRFLSLAFLIGSALPLAAQDRAEPRSALELQHRAQTRALYSISSWPRSAVRGGLDNELALPGWTSGELACDQGLLARSFRKAADESAAPSFVLETCVADSVEAAQERMLDWLAGVQSAATMPSLT